MSLRDGRTASHRDFYNKAHFDALADVFIKGRSKHLHSVTSWSVGVTTAIKSGRTNTRFQSQVLALLQ